MNPGDVLIERIRRYVSTQVPADQVDIVTRAVALTVSTLMSEPWFTNELTVIKKLNGDIQWLVQQNRMLQMSLARLQVRKSATLKRPRKRSGPTSRGKTGSRTTRSRKSPKPKKSAVRQSRRSASSDSMSGRLVEEFLAGFQEHRE